MLDRVKGICSTPKPRCHRRRTTIADLYKGYIVVIAAVPAIFGFYA